MKKGLLSIALFAVLLTQSYGALIFSENMGSPSSTTSIASNVFQNQGTLTYVGTADVRNTTVSTYAGASAGGNVFFTTSGTPTFSIGNIDTSAYAAGTFGLTFGAFKSSTASDLTEFKIEYSTDGIAFNVLTFDAQSTGTGTANWRLITVTNADVIPVASNLRLRWTNTTASTQFRLDDVTLTGDLAVVPEPGMALPLLMGISMACGLSRRRGAPVKG